MGHRHLFTPSQMFENENDQGWNHGEQPYMHLGCRHFHFELRYLLVVLMPDKVHGLKPHSDKSGITVLLQDGEVEVLKGIEWLEVPVLPNAFVVNVGDQMQIMTNGIIKSPVHRAVKNL